MRAAPHLCMLHRVFAPRRQRLLQPFPAFSAPGGRGQHLTGVAPVTNRSEGAGTPEGWEPGAWRHHRGGVANPPRVGPTPKPCPPRSPPTLLAARPPNGAAGTAPARAPRPERPLSSARLASVAVTGRGAAGRGASPAAARPRLPEATASRDHVPGGGDEAAPGGGEARGEGGGQGAGPSGRRPCDGVGVGEGHGRHGPDGPRAAHGLGLPLAASGGRAGTRSGAG